MLSHNEHAEIMDLHPTVSVIIPCHNRAELVAKAIESALAERPKVEVVVIDDGSTDDTWRVISSFPSVKARRTPNRGVSAARNYGVRCATGRFIRFLDSDDRIHLGSIARMVTASADLKYNQIAVGAASVMSEGTTRQTEYGFSNLIHSGRICGPLLLRRTLPSILTLFPRRALLAAGGYDETIRIGEDYVLAVRLHFLGYEFIQVPVVACDVLDHAGARLSRTQGADKYRSHLASFRAAQRELKDPSVAERTAFGQAIWTIGRNASRDRHRIEAEKLFQFAQEVGGSAARVGPLALKILYHFIPPFRAERFLELGKNKLRVDNA